MESLDKFSLEDKDLLKKSWRVLEKKLNDTAYNIFEMIFNQSPDTKQLFPFMKIPQNRADGRSREMEFHGLRFMQVLQSVAANIDKPQSLNPLCDNLGRVHGRLSESRGFKTHHWGVFIECTLFHFRKVLSQDHLFHRLETIDRAIILWRTVLRCLIKQMKKGFNTDIKNRQANKDAEDVGMINLSASSSSSTEISLPITHSTTLPNINGKLDNGRIQNSTGIFRPLKDFARKRIIAHFQDQS